MDINAEPDSEESEDWISLVDESRNTDSPTWRVEIYLAATEAKNAST